MKKEKNRTQVWAHRGASEYAPENTITAFRLAVEMGADGVELDVHQSRDSIPIVIHDESLERVTNGAAEGFCSQRTLAELKELDVSHGKLATPERIPSLEEVLLLLKDTNLLINIELKTDIINYSGLGKRVLDLLERLDYPVGRIHLSSFNHESIQELHRMGCKYSLGLLFSDSIKKPWNKARAYGATAIHPHFWLLHTNNYLHKIPDDMAIYTWTVNNKSEMKYFIRKGVSAIITNKPDKAVAIVQKRERLLQKRQERRLKKLTKRR